MVRHALVALAAAVAVAATAAAAAPPRATVLAVDWGVEGARLVRVDPVTLARADGSAVPLAGHKSSFRFSPDGSRVVLGRDGAASVRIVDVRAMRRAGDVALGRGAVELTRWPAPRRLLAVISDGGGVRIVTVDPATRRPLGTRVLADTSIRAHADAGEELALLLSPGSGIGPARLALAGASGLRAVTLDRIRAGLRRDEQSEAPVVESRIPGLAVDPQGRRAFVVGADEPIAVVDLTTLEVQYRPSPPALDGLEVRAKSANGPYRRAVWAGGGLVAVAGYDERAWVDAGGKHRNEAEPTGLRILDTRTWTASVIERRAASVVTGEGLLLALIGGPFHPSALHAYDRGGRLRFTIQKERPLSVMRMTRGLVYLWYADRRIAVVDAATGRVLRRTQSRVSVVG